MAESKSVVLAALFANAAIAVVKFIGFSLTGSPAMLSETYHSISDTGNQIFLLIGIRHGAKTATRSHPFGYGKAQFFYSFLVSVLLFGIAGWESASHGYHALTHGETGQILGGTVTLLGSTFPAVYVNYTVLLAGIVFESYALTKAYRGMRLDIDRHGWSGLVEAFKKTSNVTTLTAFTEDTVAVLGLGTALVGVFLTEYTGNPVYDASAALIIGLLLMGFAVALALENQRLLLGESLPRDEEDKLRTVVERTDGVDRIVDFRTVYFGPNRLLVTADVEFDPALDTGSIDSKITDMEERIVHQNPAVKKVYIEPEV
ncbi:cation diffusion facilitator family transporter [Halocalculus aciditolerans]|uniref:Transporter n=1 Tax=Halocalculus aciditolerans TaxID=1383812 RepID=A0A830FEZ3_9EURY|nr:cation diffusion facilitator family transporter [Halocalculus aciditolerans]GGL46752.1 transporter [Halocalculus aciditolerans]